MYKRLKIKLYPTKSQIEILENHFNGYRFAYNLALEYKILMWKDYNISKSGYDLSKELLQVRKEAEWLSKCKAECIREAGANVDKSFKKFFNGNGFPKFKSKKGKQSFNVHQSVSIKQNKIYFYKNLIKFKTSDNYRNILNNNKIKQITFKKDLCGDYYASCLVNIPNEKVLPKSNKVIGIDLGLKHLLITSEGEYFDNPKLLRTSHNKLKKLQRKFSKTKKGGKNREKLRIKVAKQYRKATRQREHLYHQITNKLLNDNQVIVIENLNIKGMLKNHNLARSISDVSWGLFINMLEYKAEWYNREIIRINRFEPSSKKCSKCGNKKDNLKLSDRIYKCDNCGHIIDRDLNAAINIKNSGIKIPVVPMEDFTKNLMK